MAAHSDVPIAEVQRHNGAPTPGWPAPLLFPQARDPCNANAAVGETT